MRYWRRDEGIVLPSILVGTTIMLMILLGLLWIVVQVSLWHTTWEQRISLVVDGLYTRRIVMKSSQWAPSEGIIFDEGQELRFSHKERLNWAVKHNGVYRIMSNGALQPVSGSGVQQLPSQRWVQQGEVPPFTTDDTGLVGLRWQLYTNPMYLSSLVNQSYRYDVNISFWPITEWIYQYGR